MGDNTERNILIAEIHAAWGRRQVEYDGTGLAESAANAVLAWMRENDYEKREPVSEAWIERVNRALWHYDMGLLDVHGVAERLEREPVVVDAAQSVIAELTSAVEWNEGRGVSDVTVTLPIASLRSLFAALTPEGQEANRG